MRIIDNHTPAPAPIAVNGIAIPRADIAREVQHHAGGSPKQAWEEATRACVIRELLLQRARVIGLAAEPRSENGLRETEEEALIRALLETEVITPQADEATCRRYYDANPARFRGPDLFEPLHILFQASRDDTAAYDRALARAEAALATLRESPGRFEALATAMSDCASARDGGRLGQVVTGDTTPEFETALASLAPGEISDTVRTRYGVHLIRLDRKQAGAVLPFGQVRARIAAYLEASTWRRAVTQYLMLLAGNARITGFDLPSATSPLVQ